MATAPSGSAGAYEQLTGLGSAKTLAAVPASANYAIIQAEGADIRWTCDGSTTPTTTVGMILYAGQQMVFQGPLANLKFIQVAATGIINASYFQ